MSRSKNVDLVFLYFYFYFIFHFSIFRTLGLGLEVIDHTITSVTSNGVVTVLITELVSGAVHTGIEVCRMDSEMSGLVEQPWL